MNGLPTHLLEYEKSAVLAFANQLQDFLDNDLCHLWLFGSKARGDFTPDSDIDILIVLQNLSSERRGIIRRMAARISLEHDTLINTHILDKARWDHLEKHRDTLWHEVQRDGISLGDLAIQPAP